MIYRSKKWSSENYLFVLNELTVVLWVPKYQLVPQLLVSTASYFFSLKHAPMHAHTLTHPLRKEAIIAMGIQVRKKDTLQVLDGLDYNTDVIVVASFLIRALAVVFAIVFVILDAPALNFWVFSRILLTGSKD